MDISFEAPFHTFISYEKIESMEFYNQFLNWLKGEFDLFLMEELEVLKVHFPNGCFSVTLITENEMDLSVEVKIKSKTIETANLMAAKIETINCHLKKMFSKTIATAELK